MRRTNWFARPGETQGNRGMRALRMRPGEPYVSPYTDEFLQKAKEKREQKAKRNLALLKLSLPKVSA